MRMCYYTLCVCKSTLLWKSILVNTIHISTHMKWGDKNQRKVKKAKATTMMMMMTMTTTRPTKRSQWACDSKWESRNGEPYTYHVNGLLHEYRGVAIRAALRLFIVSLQWKAFNLRSQRENSLDVCNLVKFSRIGIAASCFPSPDFLRAWTEWADERSTSRCYIELLLFEHCITSLYLCRACTLAHTHTAIDWAAAVAVEFLTIE